MNIAKFILSIRKYFVGIRKIKNEYIAFDLSLPISWKLDLTKNNDIHIEEVSSEGSGKLVVFAVKFGEVELNHLIEFVLKTIKLNLELEEKNKLLVNKIKEMRDIFLNNNLNTLRQLEFNLPENKNEDGNEITRNPMDNVTNTVPGMDTIKENIL